MAVFCNVTPHKMFVRIGKEVQLSSRHKAVWVVEV
jgi:hypothetical protein